MAKKSENTSPKLGADEKNAKAEHAVKPSADMKKKKLIVVISAIAAAVIVAGFILGLVLIINSSKKLDYMNDDLSKYVYIAPEDYKNYTLDIGLLNYSETDLQRKINKLLVSHKSKDAKFNGAAIHKPEYKLSVGDVANLWYSGYVIENGVRKNIANTSNYSDSKPYELELGSGSFIPGFEESLIGMNMMSASFKKYDYGTIMEGDVIYATYQVFLPNGTAEMRTNDRIELGTAYTENVYGKGFSDFFVGKTIGEGLKGNTVFRAEGENNDTAYYEITVNYVTRCEKNAVQIETVFPEDYSEESLRGKTVIFDVFVSAAILYDTPAWNDEFITEKLKESEETLSEYEGESLTERYENKLIKEAKAEIEERNRTLKEEAMWEHFNEKVVVKKLPDSAVTEVYQEYFNEVKTQYEMYSSYYSSLNDFAKAYFGLDEADNWRNYITKRAEAVVTEKLTFYYIMRTENIFPTDEEFKRIYDENINEYLDYYKELYASELDKCETEEERNEKIKEIEKDMMSYYGEEYFTENTYYQYASDVLLSYAKISEKS